MIDTPVSLLGIRCHAVIPAAGQGLRMGTELEKQFLDMCGMPVLAYTLEVFESCRAIEAVVLVVPGDRTSFCREEIVARFGFSKVQAVVPGGAERQDSVFRGLDAVPSDVDLVCVHDGVRPFVSADLIERTIEVAARTGAALAALPAQETVKISRDGETVAETVDRRRVFLAQTPQTFRRSLLWEAHKRAGVERFRGTDDAVLVERMGKPVHLVPGIAHNIKITTPEDLRIAEAAAGERRKQPSTP